MKDFILEIYFRISESMFLFAGLAIGIFASDVELADSKCEAKGGTCLNWKHYKCTAGYEQGLCSGGTFSNLYSFIIQHKKSL